MTEQEAIDDLFPELMRRIERNVNFLMGVILKREPRCNPIALKALLMKRAKAEIVRG